MDSQMNSEYVLAMYEQWKTDRNSVPESWQHFFMGFELARGGAVAESLELAHAQANVDSLMYAYRSQGHLIADTNPLGRERDSHKDLELSTFGLTEADLERVFDTGHLGGPARGTLGEIIGILRETYCRTIGVEYLHIQNRSIRRWLQSQMEPQRNRPQFDSAKKIRILRELINAETLEQFIHSRYPGQKRFSIEGGETALASLRALVESAPDLGVEEIVIGMAHRGRLNVLHNILGMPATMIFSEFEGNFIPDSVGGDGDVKYHKGYSTDYIFPGGRTVHLSLTANPSHLEAVDPVVEGRVRAKQRRGADTEERRRIIPLLLHGEAAFAGQGLVAETLNLSQLQGYTVGGTVHLIVNNQIGFTTLPSEGRSTFYSTDVAKMIEAPIFHVNGEDPEAVVFVSELALKFRQRFRRDVVIDMLCFRKFGHNESDEPLFTQPLMYHAIKDRPGVRSVYQQRLVAEGVLTEEEADNLAAQCRNHLEENFNEAKQAHPDLEIQAYAKRWAGLNRPYSHDPVETGVSHADLVKVARGLNTVPEGFNLNPKVARQLPRRMEIAEQLGEVDWAYAELLAIGSLLHEGIPVRLSGQDSRRGTFSQRHAYWRDMTTQAPYIAANHISPQQEKFCVYNSPLAEASVLGFEYGYSLDEPYMLNLWEAQFGDFANGAQVIIDQFLFSSHSKWQRSSGLVLLLPHGYEGQGPEHSSAYLERYLLGGAEDNIQVCNLSTPAQYFHALRRQLKRAFRLPLVVMAPKSMLRHPQCVSGVAELARGHFYEILDDPETSEPNAVERLVLCSGKVYYDLAAAGRAMGEQRKRVAIIRVEQFYPFNDDLFDRLIQRYPHVADVVWSQEESQNRGGWSFMFPRLLARFAAKIVRFIGRESSASPATGSLKIHKREQQEIVAQTLDLPERRPASATLSVIGKSE